MRHVPAITYTRPPLPSWQRRVVADALCVALLVYDPWGPFEIATHACLD